MIIIAVSNDEDSLSVIKKVIKQVRPENGLVVAHDGHEAIEILKKMTEEINHVILDCDVDNEMDFVSYYNSSDVDRNIPFVMICSNNEIGDTICRFKNSKKTNEMMCSSFSEINIVEVMKKPLTERKFFRVYRKAEKIKKGFQVFLNFKKELNDIVNIKSLVRG